MVPRRQFVQPTSRLAIWALLRAGEVYRDDLGDPTRAVRAFEAVLERDPAQVEALLGGDLRKLKPGSKQALALKQTLIEQGAWSQYLEVGIGEDAAIVAAAVSAA